MASADALTARLEAELKEWRGIQKQIQTLGNSRAQFLTQLNENEMVKKELEILEEDAEVFKMIGPTLMKQDKSEALSNVQKRIEFINSEIKKVETTAKDLGEKQEDKKKKIMDLQQQIQNIK